MNVSTTAWEAKEQTGLLARETDEQRARRTLAEDPNTPASVLEDMTHWALHERDQNRFAWFRHMDEVRKRQETGAAEDPNLWKRAPWRQSELFLQATAAHPNTPPAVLIELIGTAPLIPQITGAFFRNPVTPFLILEQPGFLSQMDGFCQLLLLRDENALPLFVQLLASDNHMAQEKAAQTAARNHIILAGEIADAETWRTGMVNYSEAVTPYSRAHEWQALLLPEKAESPRVSHRLEAVSRAETTNEPLREDIHDRTGLDLLRHLTHDGNRFVRWQAQNRLASL